MGFLLFYLAMQVSPEGAIRCVQIGEGFGGHDLFPGTFGPSPYSTSVPSTRLQVRDGAPDCWNTQSGGTQYCERRSGAYTFFAAVRYSTR